jgi:hypothetical protein
MFSLKKALIETVLGNSLGKTKPDVIQAQAGTAHLGTIHLLTPTLRLHPIASRYSSILCRK